MTAISTIISLYKQKYYYIGRRVGAGASKKAADEIKMGAAAASVVSGINNEIWNTGQWAEKTENSLANLNVGLDAIDKMHQKLNGSIIEVVNNITFFEEREAALTKVFKVGTQELALRTLAFNGLQTNILATNDEMARYRANLEATSALSGQAFSKIVKIGEVMDAATGRNVDVMGINQYIQRQITSQHYLEKNTNLTDDQIQSLSLYSAGAGRALDQQIRATDKLATAMEGEIASSETRETILEGIANLSADIRTQYKGMGPSLEQAVLKSKRLGISMDQLHTTAKSLLDIEASVGKELEYQLLSGQRLTDEKGNSLTNLYRQATLEGDMTKQANIMTQVLESQKDVLDGKNFAAKEALANTLNMSLKDLMHMKEKKDLQEQINKSTLGGQKKIDDMLNNPEALKKFTIELSKSKSEDAKKLLESITELSKKDAERRSPGEQMLMELRSIRNTGLNVQIMNVDKLKEARALGKSYKDQAEKPFKGFFDPSNPAFSELIGKFQNINKSMGIYKGAMTDISNALPYFGTKLAAVTTKITNMVEILTGANVQLKNWKIEQIKEPVGKGATAAHGDAILNVNDGVIAKFHPNDKITTVVASPYGAMNERIAGKIANPKSNNSSHSEITQLTNAINKLISTQPAPQQTDNKSIVSAIQSALGNVNFTVALDPMAIHKEIKFRSGNLNKGTTV